MNFKVCKLAKRLYLLEVMVYKSSVKPITNRNSVSSDLTRENTLITNAVAQWVEQRAIFRGELWLFGPYGYNSECCNKFCVK
jgi:hypothetical protein